MITIVPRDKAQEFITTGRIGNYNTIPQVNKELIQVIKSFIHKNVGYDNLPVACLSKAEGVEGSLSEIGIGVNDYIPVSSSTILFELQMPEDMVVSVPFEDLLNVSAELNKCKEDWEKEIFLEEFTDKLAKGIVPGENIISFIPFIDLKRCKFFAMINENWGVDNLNIPGLKEIKLNNLSVF